MNDPDYPANEGQNIADEDDGETPSGEEPKAALDDAGDPDAPTVGAGPTEDEQAKLKDQLMRLAAELENTRRRGEREKREAGQYAIANFARDLIGVADNFERALRAAGVSGESIPAGHSEEFNSLVAGIQLTEKELLKILQRHGVTKLEPAGQRFDPNLHQAVANVPSADVEKGSVVDVAQPGFTIGERVLRAAMVTVSSGAPAGGETPASEGASDEGA